MKKIVFVGIIILLSLSACIPDFLNPDSQVAPVESVVDVEATVDAAASTQAVQTFVALATPTMEDASAEPTIDQATATATATEELSPTETLTATMTETPGGTLPAETATETPDGALPAETATLEATATSIFPSPTSPIYANEVPDYIPRFKVKVRNNTKVRVYISLQGSTVGGYKPIIEYDLAPWQQIKLTVPEGRYAIIVYVGNDPMIEYIGVHSNNSVEIVIKKDSLKVTK
jgi:hypothetical protein